MIPKLFSAALPLLLFLPTSAASQLPTLVNSISSQNPTQQHSQISVKDTIDTLLTSMQNNKIKTMLGISALTSIITYRQQVTGAAKSSYTNMHLLNKNLTTGDKIKLGLFFAAPAVSGYLLKAPGESLWSAIRYQTLMTLATAIPQIIWMGNTMNKISLALTTEFPEMDISRVEDINHYTPNQKFLTNCSLEENPTEKANKANEEKEIEELIQRLNTNEESKKKFDQYIELQTSIQKAQEQVEKANSDYQRAFKTSLLENNDPNEDQKVKNKEALLTTANNDLEDTKTTLTKFLNTDESKSYTKLFEKQNQLKKFINSSLSLPHAVLIEGSTGSGKTEAVLQLAKKNCRNLLIYEYPKNNAENPEIIQLFKSFIITQAEKTGKHVIVLIDEFDQLAAERKGASESQERSSNFLSVFLGGNTGNLVPDHGKANSKIHLIAITNTLETIDKATLERFKKHSFANSGNKILHFGNWKDQESFLNFIKDKLELATTSKEIEKDSSDKNRELLEICRKYSYLPGMNWRAIERFITDTSKASDKAATAKNTLAKETEEIKKRLQNQNSIERRLGALSQQAGKAGKTNAKLVEEINKLKEQLQQLSQLKRHRTTRRYNFKRFNLKKRALR
ncbi:TPA: hypothetical protein DCW54_00380 [Candidatus Dependentiae bacterium]|nr:hypothetical protein [Candidatus Dependentiae bacterium]